ncbi:ChrR family anti-sigma-E factor [Aestuariibacter sp. AA17]|uniref:ChrR family anti-sigma-E factor n=1 Tax=Fluctibacter corallii TaxID=2984329 RepID=A0ABT3A3L4_9ALTE|nr:ChrR family anti-sigma-E factor [Aestuariibacter sp. AA17]MCV2883198.1 ChrR family anti-sigma-E factor [Aestuariibacter sp. AA17]
MINLHPTATQLQSFAQGVCSPGVALMVSAHVDMCEKCQQQLCLFLDEIGSREIDNASIDMSIEYDTMLSDILRLPEAEARRGIFVEPTLELDGKRFHVPRALQRYVAKTGNWSRLLGNLWQAPVNLGDGTKANFIFMEEGGSVPEHTHKGEELTLVIDGQFSDGIGRYDAGDFIALDGTHKHTPKADTSDGCLVFSIVDKPLHFTSGVARLLNPFSHLFF